MSCDEEALSEFLDGELAAERRAAVQAHLDTCAPCRAVLARLMAGSAAFKAAGSPRAPAGLAEAALKGAAPGRETAGRGPRWVPAALAGALALMVVLTTGKMFTPQISGIFNQTMGMISGAASTVGSADVAPAASDINGPLWPWFAGIAVLFILLLLALRRRRGR